MATPGPPPPPVGPGGAERYDALARQIAHSIDGFHSLLERKRSVLLKRVKELKEISRSLEDSREGTRDIPTEGIDSLEKKMEELDPINKVVFHSNAERFADCVEEICLLEPGSYIGRRNPSVSSGRMGGVSFPRGVAVYQDSGTVFVANENMVGPVVAYSLEGELMASFGMETIGSYAVSVYREFVFIVERAMCVNLSKFLVTGELVGTAVSVNENIRLNMPSGLCASERGVFLCNTGYNTIFVFNLNLKFIRSFGGDVLASPSDVKVNNNKIFVMNQSTNSISAFSTDFSFISHIPFQGLVVPNAFFFAIDNRSNFVVSDKDANCLRVLSPSGQLIDTLGRGHLTEPQGVDIDDRNRIVCVSQTRHNFFQIY